MIFNVKYSIFTMYFVMINKKSMFTKKLSLALVALFAVVFIKPIKSQIVSKLQADPNQAIVLNEYSASNSGAQIDSYGNASDWVEIANFWTSPVSLSGYYLSNDRNNLFKWAFPASFNIPVGGFKAVWLSGKNTFTNGDYHANFELSQCKNQWLIITKSDGVIRDSVFVQKTQLGHSRVRVNNSIVGINGWRLATANTFSLANPPILLTFKDYLPKPTFECCAGLYTPGSLCNVNGEVRIKINDHIADTVADCFVVHYTTDGNYPTTSDPVFDSLVNTNLLLLKTTMVRAVSYPKSGFATTTISCLGDIYLPSFCETNTFFYDQEYTQFQREFGVVSVAIQSNVVTSWIPSSGTTPVLSPTIHVEYFDNQLSGFCKQVTEGYGQMYKPVHESWRSAQKGFYITMKDNLGFGCDFTSTLTTNGYPIFNVDGLGSSKRTAFPTLHLKAGDFESNSLVTSPPNPTVTGTGIRDVFYQSLAAKNNLRVSPLHVKPVIYFVNGVYQGVYSLMEVFDQHYEAYYNGQAKDSVDLNICYGNVEATALNGDGSVHPQFSPISAFNTEVYNNYVTQQYPLNNLTNYNKLMSKLDKESFIDYFILGTYATNYDFWDYNVAFGRGNQAGKPGNKWHYYLWNMPTIFNFISAGNSGGIPVSPPLANFNALPCINMYPVGNSSVIATTPFKFNGHGNLMKLLMETRDATGLACGKFQLEYKNRYQDLLNGPLRCDNILAHFDYVQNLYKKEMRNHEDPAYLPSTSPYASTIDTWDTNMVRLRRIIAYRCDFMINGLKKCNTTQQTYATQGPYPVTVDVRPVGSGSVKLNSIVLPYYKWSGNYFPTTLSFKAIPTSTAYVFDHWEFKVQQPNAPLSLDSVSIGFNASSGYEEVVAVFQDITADITQNGDNSNMPSAFSPNNDNINDVYKPLGSAIFTTNYDFSIYNRWGQQVFRSTDPKVGWDGTFNGEQSQTGVYAWVITYKNVFNESKIAKGNVTLVR